MTARIGLGPSDFRQLREEGIYYVDKSRLLVELLGDPDQVLLFPRPRRFGKTLNLSMLRYFLEKSDEDRRPLFDDLAVWQSAEAQSHFGRYPVIFLTFKDAKASSFDSCMKAIRLLLAEAFARHRYLLGSAALTPEQASGFRSVIEGSAEEELCWRSLYDLTKAMASYHGEKAVVLIDEYDAPIHAGYANGYYDQVVAFFRNLLSAVLKDNPCLFKGVLTGVLRIAKESLSSGLNNVKVRSILSLRFADAFGFTEAEVRTMAEAMERPEVAEQIACWYDGYRFGETKIYNPWSVLSYAADPQDG
ncbi:MAG: hypothetical protein FJ125_10845, partial [Deltaproteobacteria bacterium]|nr:hypothetical protein [Deltaproteobacteria bacterium]